MDHSKQDTADISYSVLYVFADNAHNKFMGKFEEESHSFANNCICGFEPTCYCCKHITKDDIVNNTKKSKAVSKDFVNNTICNTIILYVL